MSHHAALLTTRLTPPRLQRRVLFRPALLARLNEALDYRLTLLQAGTGYGKTTALATLVSKDRPLVWYSLDAGDSDPHQFLAYLISAFRSALPDLSDTPLAPLRAYGEGGREPWLRSIDALLNALAVALHGPLLLVLDDYHFVAGVPDIELLVRRLVSYVPPDLHVLIATRHTPVWPELVRWRARGEVLELTRDAFAFQPHEIAALFHSAYGMQLAAADVAALADRTEGWPIALQLVWQGVRHHPTRSPAELLAHEPASLAALFSYLADDVLARQPADLAQFVVHTAVLRELTPPACAALSDALSLTTAAQFLDRLVELDLFVVVLGERHYRYHHLFHDFLRAQAASDAHGLQVRHLRAASFFVAQGNDAEAIYHWLAANDMVAAATAIERIGEGMLRIGRIETLSTWIDALPPAELAERPHLQALLGDICRLGSRFAEALAWYAQSEQTCRARNDLAGTSRALRGQAAVYLDTVRPTQAAHLLEEALRLSDGLADSEARARLLELLAENKLNMGQPAAAEELRKQAQSLREERADENALSVRVRLRTGRIGEAQTILEAWDADERRTAAQGLLPPPRSHRETLLLLSLIHALRGQAAQALARADEGIARGLRLASPFVTAVAYIRRGHALQLRRDAVGLPSDPSGGEAIRAYEEAIALGDRLAVRRVRVEVMWGLTRAHGFGGDLVAAQRAAAEGIETARWAGDLWLAALIELSLAASCLLAGQHDEALESLDRALVAFRECGDSLGRAASRLWMGLTYYELGQRGHLAASSDDLLSLAETHGYDFLFTAPSLLGPPDMRRVVPLLIEAYGRRHSAYALHLLEAIGLSGLQIHPGYQLRVQTLGTFQVWRGMREIEPREWQRDKARQLFQLLVTHRGCWLQRDEVIEQLWPTLAPDAAVRDFKVALNALNRAIEPARAADAPFAFLVREGTAYRLRPEADLWIDVVQFEQACLEGIRLLAEAHQLTAGIARLRSAIQLYRGNYLPDALYDDWSNAERERVLGLYLRAADQLAAALLEAKQLDEVITLCQSMVSYDPCWEHAYRLLMQAHASQGHRHLVLRTYHRCVTILADELGIRPSSATVALYATLTSER